MTKTLFVHTSNIVCSNIHAYAYSNKILCHLGFCLNILLDRES